ncbi:nucleoside-diphosphate kinase [candidate division WOR-3 bacterium]|nr:nucleoside-diphosphate kinase [candidate division WOR-3 bacterium]
MVEKTLFIIKPDATKRGIIGKILARIENEDFKIVELKSLKLSKKKAEKFYKIHQGKPFYPELTDFMSSGKIIVCLLAREKGVKYLREVVGATDPELAKPNTLRNLFGTSIRENAVHASDSKKTADWEISFFF